MAQIRSLSLLGPAWSRAFRCLWMLEELNLPYQHVGSVRPASRRAQQYNPSGKLPVLLEFEREGDEEPSFVLTESVAINNYLADTSPNHNLVPRPGTRERARYDQAVCCIISEIDAQGLWIHRKHEAMAKYFGAAPEAVEAAKGQFHRMNDHLSSQLNPYLLGEEFSAADIMYVHCLDWAKLIGWGDQWSDKVSDYLNLCHDRPAYLRTTTIRDAELAAKKREGDTLPAAQGFAPSFLAQHRTVFKLPLVSLSASKKNTPNKVAPGGFGVAKEDPKKKIQSKLRSVSGQTTGAGSKPLRQAANQFDKLRKEFGKEACSDVYLRSPLNSPTTYWFVGKVIASPNSAATAEQACISQKRLILEYAKTHLRPQNLGGKYAASLEIWLAPGDSEMDVVQNKVVLTPVHGSASDLPDDFSVDNVGFNPEIYVGDEVTNGGLRVQRDEQGSPVKPVFEVHETV